MKGSKYNDETRERVLTLVAGGMSASAAGRAVGVPRSTAVYWASQAEEDDEDYRAARALERKKLVKRCMGIVDKSIRTIDRQMTETLNGRQDVVNGLKVLRKMASAGMIGMTDQEIENLKKAAAAVTDVSMKEIAGVMRDVYHQQIALEGDSSAETGVQIAFADDMEDVAG